MGVMRNLSIRLLCYVVLLLSAGIGQVVVAASDDVRIVTLAPALTQILVDLDQSGSIVAIAENDLAAPADLPVVGNYLQVNIEALIAARPSHVFMMAGKAGVPKNLRRLADGQRFTLVGYPYPETIADLADIIAFDNEKMSDVDRLPSIGQVLGIEQVAAELRERMLMQLQQIKMVTSVTARQAAPRVLMVIYSNPLMASGPGSINDQLLGYIGATNAAAGAVISAPTYDREKLLAVNPDIVLLIDPKASPLESLAVDPRLALFRGLSINAVRNERFYLIDDPLAQLPTTTIPRIAAAMAKAVHPQLADRIDAVFAATICTEKQPQTQPSAINDGQP